MNRYLLISLFLFSNLLSQPADAQQNEKAMIEIEKRVNELIRAMVNADSVKLDEICLPELSYGHSSGAIDSKAVFIHKLTTGQSDFVEMNLLSPQIVVSGKSAIARHVLQAKTNDNGHPGEINLHVMLVWKKEKKKWMLLGRQSSKISVEKSK